MSVSPKDYVHLVTHDRRGNPIPREDWGERYLTLVRICEAFDPARGKLEHLFARAWHCRRIDLARRAKHDPVTMTSEQGFEYGIRVEDPEILDSMPELPAALLNSPHYESWHLHHRGLTYEQIALSLGRPMNTVKSDIHRARTILTRDTRVGASPCLSL